MLSISHAVVGASIFTVIPNPLIAAPLTLLSHYALDAVPHWDAGTGLSTGKKTVYKAIVHEIPDLILAVLLVFLFYPTNFSNLVSPSFLLSSPQTLGIFFGLLPDFLEAPRNFLGSEPKILVPLNKFHGSFHHSIPRALDGLAPQVILLTLIWLTR